MNERRQYQRWKCDIPCRCKGRNGDFEGNLENLSFNGALVRVDSGLEGVHSTLSIEVESDGASVTLAAKVVYVEQGALGVEFTDEKEDRVRQLMPLFHDHLEAEGLI